MQAFGIAPEVMLEVAKAVSAIPSQLASIACVLSRVTWGTMTVVLSAMLTGPGAATPLIVPVVVAVMVVALAVPLAAPAGAVTFTKMRAVLPGARPGVVFAPFVPPVRDARFVRMGSVGSKM